jgi:beta-ureidopropionase / N-carbamoyl-L-amino-acid hydrolase
MANRPIREDRLWADIEELATFTEPDRPWTRRAFSPLYVEGRELVKARMEAAGLAVRIDAGGNLIGRREGAKAALGALVVGSHTDTVPGGGRFDGIVGVAAGLEIARVLEERAIALDHAFEVYDCLAEEVSPYGLSCVGSRAVAGLLDEMMLARVDDEGETLRDGITRMGGDADGRASARRDDVACYLELHIEQGPVLESERLDVGIVTAIAGITRVMVEVEGRADHAGTTPMHLRADALVVAAEIVLAIRRLAEERTRTGRGHFVATVGEARVLPNAANVVPQFVSLLVDIRAEKRSDCDQFLVDLTGEVEGLASRCQGVAGRVQPVSDNAPAPSDPALLADLRRAADEIGLSRRDMASGAGHDMAWFSRIAPAAMVFVPCLAGRSHCAEEWSDKGQIARGADLLFETLLIADKRLSAKQGI